MRAQRPLQFNDRLGAPGGLPAVARERADTSEGAEHHRARDGPIEEIHPGDVVLIAPGEKHWHGATPTTAMTHIAIQEKRDGKNVDWLEQVSDEQYGA